MRLVIIILALFSLSGLYAQKGNILALKNFENGQIISSDNGTVKGNLKLSQNSYDPTMIGVFYKNDENSSSPDGSPVLVKKSNVLITEGVVEVRYNLENGEIKSGDPLTSSGKAGEAMKAGKSGMIIGVAMENSDNASDGLLKIRLSIQYNKF